MDRKVASNIGLGIFLTIALGIFTFLIFNIGAGRGLFTSTYTLYARYNQVKGLHYGSEVSLSGLRIGSVNTLSVDPKNGQELIVELSVNKKFRDRIREDSAAVIKTQGVLGDKYIEISIGSPNLPELKNGSFIRTYEPGDIFSKGGKMMEDIAKQFDKEGDVTRLLSNLNRISADLSVISGDLRREIVDGKGAENIRKALSHLEGILRKVERGEGTLGALINDPTVYEDLKTIMGGAKRSAVLRYFLKGFMESGQEKDAPKK